LVSKLDKNVLILVNRLDHGTNLREYYYDGEHPVADVTRCWFVSGETKVEDRTKIIKLMEETDNQVVIAMSSIFSTGINIKNLPFIMFVDGGKSFIRTVQSIGRGLRLHENKEQLIIFDIYDDLKYSYSHALERQAFYDEEEIPFTEIEIQL